MSQQRGLSVLTFGVYMRQKYGVRVRKIPISVSGFTCPNIDGTVLKGGCTYCDNSSFSPNLAQEGGAFFLSSRSAQNPLLGAQLEQVQWQISQTSAFFARQYGTQKFIAYFQSFSNSYAPLETLEALYNKALAAKDVIGISVGTRADCVSDDFLHLLKNLNTQEIWLEIGVQSAFNHTLKIINRGERFEDVAALIAKAVRAGINVCAHLIYGLPNETQSHFTQSLRAVLALGVQSLKIHPLYITKNTVLERLYHAGRVQLLAQEEYVRAVQKSLEIIPQHVIIQRLTAGTDDPSLVAPLWCKNKNALRAKILRAKPYQIQ
ncbi:MAG: TIGR01212 family radical SAM protein [Helicobacteraceae bacterium]